MAESVISSVVKGIGELLITESNFLHGVSQKAKQMQTELKLMQAFLEDADKRQDEDKRVQALVSEIREAAYDAEVVIETFAIKIASRRRGGIQNPFKRCACIISETLQLRKVGSQIEEITIRISNLTRSLQTYGIKPTTVHEGEASSSAHRMRRQWRQSYGHVVEEYIVGLERDIEILVAQLVSEEETYGVVSICGMGGLGKTTLAKKVFHHSDIRRHFDGFAWAYISQQCQRRDVWEGILFDLLSPSKEQREEIKGLRDEEVARKLYQVLQGKKCLVILDDIWTTEAWHGLNPSFPIGKAGSKLLLTTRNKEVALHVHPSSFLHEPRCLNEEESWELLQKKAFQGKHGPDFRNNIDMEKLGRKMVKRCAGLPLAIVVLGGVLATKHTLNEWNMVHENISSNLRRAKGDDQHDSGLFEVLALSYHELPYQLKACFLHLGHFPEDFEIPTKKLVRMWVADGIVSSMQYAVEGEETMEDIAQHYLGELIYRCMVQVGVVGSTGRVRTCRLHDLMRDLSLLKANQENFLKIVHFQDGNKQGDYLSSTHQVHRLAVYLGEEPLKFFPKQQRTLNLRSLSFFSIHYHEQKISQEVLPRFRDFKLLKILDLEDCGIEGKFTNAIGNLIHLRYLSLCFHVEVNLSSSIGNLRCLQTLILRSNNIEDVRVPNVIWKMEQLRHLYLPNLKKCSSKLRLDNLRALQTLKGFDTRTFDVLELINLTNLRKLGISCLDSNDVLVEVLRSSSVNFNSLFSLKIVGVIIEETDLVGLLSSCPQLYKLSVEGLINKLPEFHEFPSNLTKLTLTRTHLREDPMAKLEKLPNLTVLLLDFVSFIGKRMVCSSKAFPQLKSLGLKRLNLEEWFVGEEAMPSLCELTIRFCTSLKMIPDGLRSISTLQELKVEGMLEEFNNRLRGGEDSYKVQHVPSIIIR